MVIKSGEQILYPEMCSVAVCRASKGKNDFRFKYETNERFMLHFFTKIQTVWNCSSSPFLMDVVAA